MMAQPTAVPVQETRSSARCSISPMICAARSARTAGVGVERDWPRTCASDPRTAGAGKSRARSSTISCPLRRLRADEAPAERAGLLLWIAPPLCCCARPVGWLFLRRRTGAPVAARRNSARPTRRGARRPSTAGFLNHGQPDCPCRCPAAGHAVWLVRPLRAGAPVAATPW